MLKRRYAIKSGYQIRKENAPYVDVQPTGTVYQPHVYDFALSLLRRGGFKYLIDIGAGSGEKLAGIDKETKVIAIDFAPNIKALRKNLPNAEVIDFNLEKGLPHISEEIARQAIVISSDVIEHIVEPHKYMQGLARLSKFAPFVLVSTPDRTRARGPENYGPPDNPFHVREWSIDELYSLFRNYGVKCKIGYTMSNDEERLKATSLVVAGTHAMPSPYGESPSKTALAIMTAYNEDDIIEQSITHLLNQGLDVHVIDNWSTDKTLSIVKKLAKKHYNVTYENFPAKKPKIHKYEWKKLLIRVEEVAETVKHDWVIHNDADEFRLSPWKGVSLIHALSFISGIGYNAIDFTVANFRPAKDGYKGTVVPDEFFHDFEFGDEDSYFQQVKGWEHAGRIDLAGSGGHSAEFTDRKIFPFNFISKHYPLRSMAQANRKVFNDRVGQFNEEELKLGWHIQYNAYKPDDRFIWEEKYLNKFTPDFFYTEYMVELLSNLGIREP